MFMAAVVVGVDVVIVVNVAGRKIALNICEKNKTAAAAIFSRGT